MAQREPDSVVRFLIGVGVGIAITWGYVRFGFELPGIADLPGQVMSGAISMTADADLENWELPLEARQRAAAVVFAQNPDRLIEIDNALDHAVLNELWRKKAVRRAQILNSTCTGYDKVLAQPALRDRHERKFNTADPDFIKARLLAQDIRDDGFLQGYLVRFWPDDSPAERAARVQSVAEHQLRPQPAQRVADSEQAVLR